jgi:hypothetical protein
VNEVWRHEGPTLEFYELRSGNYESIDHSRAFPFLRPDDLSRFLDQIETVDETSLLKSFANWVGSQGKAT